MNVDLLIGLNADKLNQCVNNLFANQSIRQSVFQGSSGGTYEDIAFKLDWKLETAPHIEFRGPTGAEWDLSVKANGVIGFPIENAFVVKLDTLNISFFDGSETRQTTIPITVICNAPNNGQKLLAANSVVLDRSPLSDMDRYVADDYLIPQIIASVNQILAGLNVPVPSYMGVSLTAPRAAIANNKFIVGFNTIEHAQPELNEISVPDRPFFVLASQELLRIAANYAVTTNIQGKSFHKEDSDGYMGFRASYSADAMATGISIRTTGVPSMLKADVSLSMQAGGGISTPSIDPTTW